MSLSNGVLFESTVKERAVLKNFLNILGVLVSGMIVLGFLELIEDPITFHEHVFKLLYIGLGVFLIIVLAIFSEMYAIRIEGKEIRKSYLFYKWKDRVIHFDDIQTIEFLPVWVKGERNQLLIYPKQGRVMKLEVQAEEVYIPLLRTINQINIPFYIREKSGRKEFEEDRKEILHNLKMSGIQYNDYLYPSFLLAYPKPM